MTLLKRHRGVLLSVVGIALITAAWKPEYRVFAIALAFVSKITLMFLVWTSANYASELKQVALIDVGAMVLLGIVLPELAYLILREMDVDSLVKFLRRVVEGDFELERTTESDLESAAEILEKYDDNNIELVDAVIVAMAERLEIEKILTVDRRHFGVFKPKHCEAFTLLP